MIIWLENFVEDLRYGIRLLRRQPGHSAVAATALALGIGTTSSVFGLVHGVLLTPPLYPRPERIMLIRPAKAVGGACLGGPTTEQWTGWQKESRSFEVLAGYDWT